MRLMHVNDNFIEKNFENVGGEPEGDHPYNPWVVYLTCRPVLDMILEGDDSIRRVHEITSSKEEESLFWDNDGPTSYSSDSVMCASEDIKMWFREDCKEWLKEITKSTHLIHVYPDGKSDLQRYYSMDKMSIVVIKPKAFREFCVGEILEAVEVNCFLVRGLKLVKKADCPKSVVWSDSCSSSETDGDECALAMVAEIVAPKLELLHDDPDAKYIDFSSKIYRVGSNYIYKSNQDTLWNDMAEFFPYGLILWVDPSGEHVCAQMFEASLIGIVSQD
ncbi:hypothetical protein MKW98_009264 [Papaver atlanticum]|uniref:Uncharacterized protein n=1 Tax=Papaver atlanticum TaxID=357466 RepID=A0AAD4XQU8_9MAGN|nr:hypothetical protein MKW98_009264 [Papaver atlanticum]